MHFAESRKRLLPGLPALFGSAGIFVLANVFAIAVALEAIAT